MRFGTLAKLSRIKVPEGRDGDIQLSLALAREIASPAYPFDEHAAREWIEREADSGPRDTKAQSRQVGAPWHGPKLRELHKPVLVLHGDQDPILRVSAARATAKAIDGARLVILPGVGHDLPAPLWPAIAGEVRELADQARPPAQAELDQQAQGMLDPGREGCEPARREGSVDGAMVHRQGAAHDGRHGHRAVDHDRLRRGRAHGEDA